MIFRVGHSWRSDEFIAYAFEEHLQTKKGTLILIVL